MLIVKKRTKSRKAPLAISFLFGGQGKRLAAVLQNELAEDLGRLVKLLQFNPFVYRMGLVDTPRTEDYRGNFS